MERLCGPHAPPLSLAGVGDADRTGSTAAHARRRFDQLLADQIVAELDAGSVAAVDRRVDTADARPADRAQTQGHGSQLASTAQSVRSCVSSLRHACRIATTSAWAVGYVRAEHLVPAFADDRAAADDHGAERTAAAQLDAPYGERHGPFHVCFVHHRSRPAPPWSARSGRLTPRPRTRRVYPQHSPKPLLAEMDGTPETGSSVTRVVPVS